MTHNPVVQLTAPLPAREADHVRVFLRDCRVELSIGIYEREKQKLTSVIVNVEVEATLPHHYQDLSEAKLDRVINYEPFYHFIQKELPRLGHIHLLETVAEQIISFCFQDVRVQKVRVRLEKPNIFDSANAGIEVCRTR